jgi:hypothetical protein
MRVKVLVMPPCRGFLGPRGPMPSVRGIAACSQKRAGKETP